MSNYIVSNTELESIADAIRMKKGTSATIPFTNFADEIESISGGGEDLYQKHIPVELKNIDAFTTSGTIMDIFADDTNVVAVNARTDKCLSIVNKSNNSVVRLSPTPTGADATDLPQDMSEFHNSGTGFSCRSITATEDYYIIGIRYSSGVQADGTHLYGGVVFVSKSTKTVVKSYWLPCIISRVVYDEISGVLAVGLQMGGLRFYSINGSTLTELETFLYDQSNGSPTKGRESQCGCFYSASNGHRFYANAGFGAGVRFYDVTNPSAITYVAEFKQNAEAEFSDTTHTYSAVVDFPYLYMTIAPSDKVEIHTDLVGVLTINVSDLNHISVEDFEHISSNDGVVWNEFGDTKPTEMKRSKGTLYLNYEKGYLAFEIDSSGKKTHYCGRYNTTETIYGIGTEPNGDFYVGTQENSMGVVRKLSSDASWTISKSLSNVTLSNKATKVDNNASFQSTVTIPSGYELDSMAITMGGTDITATVFSNNEINIPRVTADVTITARASAPVNAYWKPSDGTVNQYTGSKPCTLTVSGDDVSMEITQGNSGFKTAKNIETPTANLKLKLIADSVTIVEPTSAHSLNFGITFYDANNTNLKLINFLSSSSAKYVEDITEGITVTANINDIGTATHVNISCRSVNSSDASLFPINVAFTNLRIEVAD